MNHSQNVSQDLQRYLTPIQSRSRTLHLFTFRLCGPQKGTPQKSTAPPWIEDAKKVKQIPVCKCRLERANCDDCSEGYLDVALQGKIPQFKGQTPKTGSTMQSNCIGKSTGGPDGEHLQAVAVPFDRTK